MKSAKGRLFRLLLIIVLLLTIACSKTPQLPPLAADATILAFGDSLTAGTGAAEAESYPAVLARLTGRKVINAGLPGEVSASGLQRLPELLRQERPQLIILCHGGNDLLGHLGQQQLAENLRGMLRLAREQGIPVLLLAVPSPDFTLTPPPLYAELAKEFAAPLESKALKQILAKSRLKADHIHPNAAGYALLAEAVLQLLKKSGALSG